MRPDSIEGAEYFWSPRRPAAARHVRRDPQGNIVRAVAHVSGRPKEEPADSLRRQIDAVTGSLRSWLLTGTRRIPIDPRRKQGVHEGLRLLLTENQDSLDSHSQEISESMKRQAVVEAMNRLSDQDSQVIKLAYFGGKTNDEIAETTGMPVSSVRRRLREGLRQMQAQLESTGLVDVARGAGTRRGLAGLVGWLATRFDNRNRRGRSSGLDWLRFGSGDSPTFLQGALVPASAAIALGMAGVVGAHATNGFGLLAHAPASIQVGNTKLTVGGPGRAAGARAKAATLAATAQGASLGGSQAAAAKTQTARAKNGQAQSGGHGAVGAVVALAHGATSSIAVKSDGQIVKGATGTSSTLDNTTQTVVSVAQGVTNAVSGVTGALPGPH